MKIDRHYYRPTEEKRAEIKAHAALIKARIRVSRNMQDMQSAFSRMNVGAQQETKAVAKLADEFKGLGWSDSAAGELAQIQREIGP